GSDDVAKQIARWTALAALFLIPLTPLLVSSSFFFPFITGKAFYFRILVEIAVAAWAVLALLDTAYRPRFSWAGAAVLAFVLWMLVADAFAVNAVKAFWSNFERMEGWVLLVHLLGFFFAASSVLRVEKKWRLWFLTSLGVAVLVSIHALLQLAGSLPIHQGSTRIDSSFGNSAYLAIYLLFNTFLAGWLALTEKRAWLKWLLLAFAVVEAVLVFFTETRGTVLGLVGGLLLAALLTALTAGKRARQYATGGVILIVVLAGSFYLARSSALVQDNHVLQRIASISLSQGEVRFTIWGMAWQGFLERPVTGWGQEGFNYVFNQYYNPSLYTQEAWFDRAHNAFIDWLEAGGLPAFLLYLSLFATAVWLLWKSSELSRAERIALTAALAGYACHNLFVFDNLYSYVYFFAILALIDSQVARPIRRFEEAPELSSAQGATFALPVAAVAGIACVWFVNVSGMTGAAKLVQAISLRGDYTQSLALFTDLTTHPIFAEQEVREQIVSLASTIVQDSSAPDAQKQEAVTMAVTEMRKQVASYPKDARGHLELALAYRTAGDAQDALKEILAAAALSPKKETIWIEAGVTEWDLNDPADAKADFDKAYALGPQFPDLAAYAAAGDYAAGDVATGDQVLTSAYGTTNVDNDILAVAYFRAKLWTKLINLWTLRASAPSAGPNELFGLASAYYVAGRNAEAIAVIEAAMAKYPQTKDAGQAAISQIQSGAAPR
ncbi:MAG TPA: O-antigen ligase family protein, partial [Candidatus Paceibacterota bacterium]|nr:O-antigen ligase family protein [Candidatus Paceibacterota bacterium]